MKNFYLSWLIGLYCCGVLATLGLLLMRNRTPITLCLTLAFFSTSAIIYNTGHMVMALLIFIFSTLFLWLWIGAIRFIGKPQRQDIAVISKAIELFLTISVSSALAIAPVIIPHSAMQKFITTSSAPIHPLTFSYLILIGLLIAALILISLLILKLSALLKSAPCPK